MFGSASTSCDASAIDATGRLTLQGRADDLINYGGAKVVPAVIEEVLARHPAIAEVALVGIADADAGELPVAFAVFRGAPDPEELRRYCAQNLDLGQVPDEVYDPLRDELGDVAVLELTYITAMYLMQSVMSRALRTEQDA